MNGLMQMNKALRMAIFDLDGELSIPVDHDEEERVYEAVVLPANTTIDED